MNSEVCFFQSYTQLVFPELLMIIAGQDFDSCP